MAPGTDPRPAGRHLAARGASVAFISAALLLLVLASWRMVLFGGPSMNDDSYQYLSVAANTLDGRFGQTSLVYYDTERSHGRVPAPMTSFPPGYPMAIALGMAAGLAGETASLLVSLAAHLSTLALLAAVARRAGIDGGACWLMLLAYAGNATAAMYGTSSTSEALFTALTLAGQAALLSALSPGDARPVRALPLAGAYLLLGMAFGVRYAGLFGLLCALGWHALAAWRRPSVPWHSLWVAVPGLLIVAAIMLRNHLLVGSWKGGNTLATFSDPWPVLASTAPHMANVLFGVNGRTAMPAMTPMVVVCAGLLALLLAIGLRRAWVAAAAERRPDGAAAMRRDVAAFFPFYLLAYVAAIAYVRITSVTAYDARMLLPTLPGMLLLLAVAWHHRPPAWRQGRPAKLATAGLAVLGIVYAAANLRSVPRDDAQNPHRDVHAALAEPLRSGGAGTLGAWLAAQAPPGTVLVANQGQALGYVLDRPVLGLLPRRYTAAVWDEAFTRTQARRVGARYLVLLRRQETAPLKENEFLAALAAFGPVPAWLQPAVSTANVVVYRIQP